MRTRKDNPTHNFEARQRVQKALTGSRRHTRVYTNISNYAHRQMRPWLTDPDKSSEVTTLFLTDEAGCEETYSDTVSQDELPELFASTFAFWTKGSPTHTPAPPQDRAQTARVRSRRQAIFARGSHRQLQTAGLPAYHTRRGLLFDCVAKGMLPNLTTLIIDEKRAYKDGNLDPVFLAQLARLHEEKPELTFRFNTPITLADIAELRRHGLLGQVKASQVKLTIDDLMDHPVTAEELAALEPNRVELNTAIAQNGDREYRTADLAQARENMAALAAGQYEGVKEWAVTGHLDNRAIAASQVRVSESSEALSTAAAQFHETAATLGSAFPNLTQLGFTPGNGNARKTFNAWHLQILQANASRLRGLKIHDMAPRSPSVWEGLTRTIKRAGNLQELFLHFPRGTELTDAGDLSFSKAFMLAIRDSKAPLRTLSFCHLPISITHQLVMLPGISLRHSDTLVHFDMVDSTSQGTSEGSRTGRDHMTLLQGLIGRCPHLKHFSWSSSTLSLDQRRSLAALARRSGVARCCVTNPKARTKRFQGTPPSGQPDELIAATFRTVDGKGRGSDLPHRILLADGYYLTPAHLVALHRSPEVFEAWYRRYGGVHFEQAANVPGLPYHGMTPQEVSASFGRAAAMARVAQPRREEETTEAHIQQSKPAAPASTGKAPLQRPTINLKAAAASDDDETLSEFSAGTTGSTVEDFLSDFGDDEGNDELSPTATRGPDTTSSGLSSPTSSGGSSLSDEVGLQTKELASSNHGSGPSSRETELVRADCRFFIGTGGRTTGDTTPTTSRAYQRGDTVLSTTSRLCYEVLRSLEHGGEETVRHTDQSGQKQCPDRVDRRLSSLEDFPIPEEENMLPPLEIGHGTGLTEAALSAWTQEQAANDQPHKTEKPQSANGRARFFRQRRQTEVQQRTGMTKEQLVPRPPTAPATRRYQGPAPGQFGCSPVTVYCRYTGLKLSYTPEQLAERAAQERRLHTLNERIRTGCLEELDTETRTAEPVARKVGGRG